MIVKQSKIRHKLIDNRSNKTSKDTNKTSKDTKKPRNLKTLE